MALVKALHCVTTGGTQNSPTGIKTEKLLNLDAFGPREGATHPLTVTVHLRGSEPPAQKRCCHRPRACAVPLWSHNNFPSFSSH